MVIIRWEKTFGSQKVINKLETVHRLQSVQDVSATLLTSKKKTDHIIPLLMSFHFEILLFILSVPLKDAMAWPNTLSAVIQRCENKGG